MALIQAQELLFRAREEPLPGAIWKEVFEEFWPSYQRWYLQDGANERPYYLRCVGKLREYMPELMGTYETLTALTGGGDLEARFLSLYCPPPYLTGCSQAVVGGDSPLLVRNYDYAPQLCEGLILKTCWNGRAVIGVSDCLWGLLDGINQDGLAASLSFGGRRVVGDGFGVPLVVRYVLETCTHTPEAISALTRIPVHMSYNVTVVDARGAFATVFLSPDRSPEVRIQAAATNHQRRVEWHQHATATATVERERHLMMLLADKNMTDSALRRAFLQPPVYSRAFDRGFGTLYSAAYWPQQGRAEYYWPGDKWPQSFAQFDSGDRQIGFFNGSVED